MIAFNFNIHFLDEPSLDDGFYDDSKEDFRIVKSSDTSVFDSFDFKSAYTPIAWREARYGAQKEFAVCKKGCRWGIEVKGMLFFLWRCGEHTIEYVPQKPIPPQMLQFWVLHTVLPFLLFIEESYDFLHVGAVEVKGEPILFSAESFGGKSTMTDYFIRQGHTMLSDDSLGIFKENGKYMAVPAYPFHRPFREAESLGYRITNVTGEPKPLKAVYLLDRVKSDAIVEINEVNGIEKFKAFYFSSFINLTFRKTHRFKLLSDMARNIPVYKVTVPWDTERLGEVYKSIIQFTSRLVESD